MTGPVGLTVEVGYDDDHVTAAYRWDRARWDGTPPEEGRWGPVFDWTALQCDVSEVTVTRGAGSAVGRYQSSTATITARDPTGTLAPWWTDPPGGARRNRPNVPLRVGLSVDGAPTEVLFTGWVDTWEDTDTPADPAAVVVITASDGLKHLAHADAAEQAAQGAGEHAGTRINRILDNAEWVAARRISPGSTPLQATTLARPALEEMWLTVDTEAGRLYVDRHGAIVFADRAAMVASELRWTFTDGSAGTTGICPGALVTLGDDLDLANVVGVARAGGTAVWRQDDASITRNKGRRSWARFDLIHTDDAWSGTLADLQLADRTALEWHIAGVILYPLADPAAWPVAIDAELGDLCWVVRRRGGRILDTRARIVGLTHHATPYAYTLAVTLGPPIRTPLGTWDNAADGAGWDEARWSPT